MLTGEDLCASLEPGGLSEGDSGVLGEQLRGQAAQSSEHSLHVRIEWRKSLLSRRKNFQQCQVQLPRQFVFEISCTVGTQSSSDLELCPHSRHG